MCVFKRAVLLCTVDMEYHKMLTGTGRPHVSHTREAAVVIGSAQGESWAGREERDGGREDEGGGKGGRGRGRDVIECSGVGSHSRGITWDGAS
jgi:hypothetical protein